MGCCECEGDWRIGRFVQVAVQQLRGRRRRVVPVRLQSRISNVGLDAARVLARISDWSFFRKTTRCETKTSGVHFRYSRDYPSARQRNQSGRNQLFVRAQETPFQTIGARVDQGNDQTRQPKRYFPSVLHGRNSFAGPRQLRQILPSQFESQKIDQCGIFKAAAKWTHDGRANVQNIFLAAATQNTQFDSYATGTRSIGASIAGDVLAQVSIQCGLHRG
mmetsp:Transcript_2009/g.2801  ORF Transcript_2009/g.2801 Transcript_2009/m.2801 type:complete len:219 (-) Transcript_2009:462-1118(-)